MSIQARMVLGLLAAGCVLVVGTQSLGQSRGGAAQGIRRDVGGSCVYDKQGRVVFAPDGKLCPDATQHLSTPREGNSPIVASYPPALQGELSGLLRDHEHIAQEIARLRKEVESQDRKIALQTVDKIRAEITDHRAREEAFFEKMAPN